MNTLHNLQRLPRKVRLWRRLKRRNRLRRQIEEERRREQQQRERLHQLERQEYERKLIRQRRRKQLKKAFLLLVLVLVVSVCGAAGVLFLHTQEHEYIISTGTETHSITMLGGSIQEACKRAGLSGHVVVSERDEGRVTYVDMAQELRLSIRCGNQTIQIKSAPDVVSNILQNVGIEVGEEDIVVPALDTWVDEDSNIDVIRVTRQVESEEQQIPFEVEQRDTVKLNRGQERVVQYGEYGTKEVTYQVTLHDGREVVRTVLDETVLTYPQSCIVEVGIRPPKDTDSETESSDNTRPLPASLLAAGSDNATDSADSTAPADSSPTADSTTPTTPTDSSQAASSADTAQAAGSTDSVSDSSYTIPKAPETDPSLTTGSNQSTSGASGSSGSSDSSDSSDSSGSSSTPSASTAPKRTSSGELSTEGRKRVWSVPCSVKIDEEAKTLTTADNVVLPYSSVINVKATAYHHVEDGGQITAMGTNTDYGTVAVDPRVIPLNSRVYIVSDGGVSWSYGPGIAEDTGGLIKGAKIDLFFMTGDEAEDFGVRDAKIYILKDDD